MAKSSIVIAAEAAAAGRRAAHRPADVAAPTHCSAKRWHNIVGRATCLSPLVDGVCPVAHRHSDVKAA